ncbi:endo-beta-glucanase [Amanita muscaria]
MTMMKFTAASLLLLGAASSALGFTYELETSVVGSDFYNNFVFENITDPTHGRVTYVDKATAISQNLTYASHDAFILSADHKTVLDPNGPGRNSVRLRSVSTYQNSLLVFDIRHMPQGCGTWPAVWTLGPNWPYGGEIDIVEGVNDQSPNAATLHTGPNCTMPANRNQLGTTALTDCYGLDNSNAGCGVKFPTMESYGPSFNDIGGGWYAMERSNTQVRVWFWPRNGYVPLDVQAGLPIVNPDLWGTPSADFPNTDCDINSHFAPQSIVINLTFCGDWAGNVYSSSGCPGTCVDYVNNNPEAFAQAYFEFASLKTYQSVGFQ